MRRAAPARRCKPARSAHEALCTSVLSCTWGDAAPAPLWLSDASVACCRCSPSAWPGPNSFGLAEPSSFGYYAVNQGKQALAADPTSAYHRAVRSTGGLLSQVRGMPWMAGEVA